MKIIYIVLVSFFITVASSCSKAINLVETNERIFPSVLNLPVYKGTKKSTDCKVEEMFPGKKIQTECLLFPMTELARKGGKDPFQLAVSRQYGKLMIDQGWKIAPVNDFTFTVSRDITTTCSETLILLVWLNGEASKVKRAFESQNFDAFENVSLVFIRPKNKTCDALPTLRK